MCVWVVDIMDNLLTSQNHDGETISRAWGDVRAKSRWLKMWFQSGLVPVVSPFPNLSPCKNNDPQSARRVGADRVFHSGFIHPELRRSRDWLQTWLTSLMTAQAAWHNSDVWGREETILPNCSTQAGFYVISNMIYEWNNISMNLKKEIKTYSRIK